MVCSQDKTGFWQQGSNLPHSTDGTDLTRLSLFLVKRPVSPLIRVSDPEFYPDTTFEKKNWIRI